MLQDSSDQRKVFLRSPREEQIAMLWDMVAFVRSKQAEDLKQHDDFDKDIKYLNTELRGIGRRREKVLDTSERIEQKFSERAASWIWYRDKVLANTLAFIQTTIVIAILYMVFGGKLP